MSLTPYHARYLAYELTKRCPSDSVEKLATVLADAQVDLNPHQVEAALFAFRSPFSRGAILADEVGVGKTIEAGLLLSQKWGKSRRVFLGSELQGLDTPSTKFDKPPNYSNKLERQREVSKLETKRDEAWRAYDQASRELDKQKDALLDEISTRLEQSTEQEALFLFKWRLE